MLKKDMYTIRRINENEVDEALDLALDVFMEFEAPEYKPQGVETFRQFIIEGKKPDSDCKKGLCPMYAAFDDGKMIGITRMRKTKTHINLMFVRKEYHRQGVATALFRFLLEDILKENPSFKEITLNSSPYGKEFYLHIGFIPLSEEQEQDGIRFTPMKYIVNEE